MITVAICPTQVHINTILHLLSEIHGSSATSSLGPQGKPFRLSSSQPSYRIMPDQGGNLFTFLKKFKAKFGLFDKVFVPSA